MFLVTWGCRSRVPRWTQLFGTTAEQHPTGFLGCNSSAVVSVETAAYQSRRTFPRLRGLKARLKITSSGRVVVWPNKIQRRCPVTLCLCHLVQLKWTTSGRGEWNSLLALLLIKPHLCLANRAKILLEAAAVVNVICRLLPHRSSKRRFHHKCRVTARLHVRRVFPPLGKVLLVSNQSSWQPGN